jgi:hypothetical protein
LRVDVRMSKRLSLLALALASCVPFQTVGVQAPPPGSSYEAVYQDCMRYGGATEQSCAAVAQSRAGSAHETVLDENNWVATEALARSSISAPDTTPVFRVDAQGFMAQHRLPLAGGTCYKLGVAWGSGRASQVTIGFEGGANDQIGRRGFDLTPPAGSVDFCADNPGTALVTITATESGIMAQNVRFQYALALMERTESAQERTVRRQDEAERVRQGRAQIETNLQIADAREGGEAFARSCARCRAAYYDCDAQGGGRCQPSFEICAQALGTDRYGRVLCASPP